MLHHAFSCQNVFFTLCFFFYINVAPSKTNTALARLRGGKNIQLPNIGQYFEQFFRVKNAENAAISNYNVVYTSSVNDTLDNEYLRLQKVWPYVGNEVYTPMFPTSSRHYFNSLAVFPKYSPTRMHGIIGLLPSGTSAYVPKPTPPPINSSNKAAALKNGGFYLELSNALPLDRDPKDMRPSVCKKVHYNLSSLSDVSIIITFYNEPISTLLRSVHSILNRTPPPLLREIILVDDHSNLTDVSPGGFLYDYLPLVPKLKVMRLPERRGLVSARLAGARAAAAPILVVLDSHIEVNDGWLEPQLQRIQESPESIVFPQIPSVHHTDLTYNEGAGIGCTISFKWAMQEKSQAVIIPSKTDALPSPSMAGGLFAVRADWFWELGGFDEEFSMWGAENVEMGFRTWMCGGRLECAPCGYVYHIYRSGGSGYSSPPQSLWKNRLRTSRIWTDHFYQLTSLFVHHEGLDIGSLDHMLELKERLRCKNFTWFLENVDKVQPFRVLDALQLAGEIKNKHAPNMCIDTLSHSGTGKAYGMFYCHHEGGTQGFLWSKFDTQLHSFTDESICLADGLKLDSCFELSNKKATGWTLGNDSTIYWTSNKNCLTYNSTATHYLQLEPCVEGKLEQQWTYQSFQPDPNFALPDFSDAYKIERNRNSLLK